jgi:hypothetical protein
MWNIHQFRFIWFVNAVTAQGFQDNAHWSPLRQ